MGERRTRFAFTRLQGQSFQIGDDVTVTIVKVSGRTVKVLVEAPLSVNIVRCELLEGGQTA